MEIPPPQRHRIWALPKTARQDVVNRMNPVRTTDIEGAKGLAPFHIACKLSLDAPIVIVANTNDEAEDALRNVRFILGEEQSATVLYLPSDERGPYHATSLDPLTTME